ncbi:MAG: hypothetical protein KJZ65_10930 [Phycisphaerales bacterium]|nr:hypothetical protein [Phycisphaerales bacterium]
MTTNVSERLHFIPVLALAAAVIMGGLLIIRTLQWKGSHQILPPPRIDLRVLVNGQAPRVNRYGVICVTPGDEITPLIDVDWHGQPPGTLTMTFGGRHLANGEVFRPSGMGMGVGVLRAEAQAGVTNGIAMPASDRLEFEVTMHPRFDAEAQVLSVETGETGPLDIRAIVVRLASQEIDIQNIWLTHVSLHVPVAELDDDILPVAQRPVGDTQTESGPAYAARFADGAWTLRFERAEDAPPLHAWPKEILLTGSGWRGDQTIEFFATVSLPPTVGDARDASPTE